LKEDFSAVYGKAMSELKRKPNLRHAIEQDEILQSFSLIQGVTFYVGGATVLYMLSKMPIEGYYLHFYGAADALHDFFKHDMVGKKIQQIVYDEFSRTWACSFEGKNILVTNYPTARQLSEGMLKFSEAIGIPVLSLYVSLGKKDFGKLFDNCDGYADFGNNIIRASDNINEAFWGHPGFLLSLCYYTSKFCLVPDDGFIKAIAHHAEMLNVSAQEGASMFFRILTTQRPSYGLKLLHETGLLEKFFPEASKMAGVEPVREYHHKDVFYHTCEVVDNISAVTDDVWLRFAAFVHDIAKPHTKKLIEGTGWTFHGHEEKGARLMQGLFYRLGLDREKLPYIQKMIRLHLRPSALVGEGITDSAVRRLITEAGEHLDDLLKLCRADITSKNPNKVNRVRKNYDVVEEKILAVKQKDELAAFQSPVKGDEIMKICGLKPSKKVGEIKSAIEDAILKGEIDNTYESALQYLMQIKDSFI
jgi:tRNA nucleotidyltransferase/poly(A) polymerase